MNLTKLQNNYKLVVVGGGAARVEIGLAAQQAFKSAGVNGQVDLVASLSGLPPGHSQSVQMRVQRFAERAGSGLHFAHGVGSEDGVLLADGHFVSADQVIAATGSRPAVWLELSKLALDERGYILVDRYQRSMSHPNVFAAGDVCARLDAVMPRSGVHSVHAGPVLAENLLAIVNAGSLRSVQPQAPLFIHIVLRSPIRSSVLGRVVGRRTMGVALEKLD